jgi:large subunit ribosomal protein L18
MRKKTLNTGKIRRSERIRKKISGTTSHPRLSIYRSLSNIYAQIIDDSTGKTLVAISSLNKELKGDVAQQKGKTAVSKIIGAAIAKKAIEANIKTVVFDRNGYQYHGRVKAVADAAREAGLKF